MNHPSQRPKRCILDQKLRQKWPRLYRRKPANRGKFTFDPNHFIGTKRRKDVQRSRDAGQIIPASTECSAAASCNTPNDSTSTSLNSNLTTQSEQPYDAHTCTIENAPVQATMEYHELDDGTIYYQHLLMKTSFVLLVDDADTIIVQDYNCLNKTLRDSVYQCVRRRVFLCENTCHEVLYCSCNPAKSAFIASISSNVDGTLQDFQQLVSSSCQHACACELLWKAFDAHQLRPALELCDSEDHPYTSTADKTWKVTPLPNSSCGFAVLSPGDMFPGFVFWKKTTFTCKTCNKACRHTKYLRGLSTDDDVEDDLATQLQNCVPLEHSEIGNQRTSSKVVSYKTIQYHVQSNLKDKLQHGLLFDIPTVDSVFLFVPPSTDDCRHCGGSFDEQNPVEQNWLANDFVTVVTRTFIGQARTYYRPCLGCDSNLVYDGSEDGFLNCSSHLFGHDVLRTYMHSFLLGRRPLYTHYLAWKEELTDYSQDTSYISYADLRMAWNGYLSLLDVPIPDNFSCRLCKDKPEVIICDGTTVSFQRRMMPPLTNPEGQPIIPRQSSFQERIFLPDSDARQLLRQFCLGGLLSSSDFENLLQKCLKVSPHLHSLVTECKENSQQLNIFKKFLLVISAPSPVCTLLPATKEMDSIIKTLVNENIHSNPSFMEKLQQQSPIIFDVLSHMQPAPPEFLSLIVELWKVALQPFQGINAVQSIANTEESPLAYFPKLPIVRSRGVYEVDSNRIKKADICSKKSKGHPSLLPGIFTIFCPHGICYGFEVMQVHESPNVPFSVLFTRFGKAPKVVVYDNACALHAYCLNRQPCHFQETVFLVDRLHWFNHSSCSLAYELDQYPHLKKLNSQINEQANSGLKRIKAQVSYMNHTNFMKHVSFYLWKWNVKKNV